MKSETVRVAVLGLALIVVFACGFGHAAMARWLRAETPLFVVYSDGDEASLRAFSQDLQDYDAHLQSATGIAETLAPSKLTVYLLDSKAGLREINRYAPSEVIGFYNATPNGIFLAAIRNSPFGERMPARTVIFHEYTHHFIHQYDRSLYPDWLDEGLAEYYATAEITADPSGAGTRHAWPHAGAPISVMDAGGPAVHRHNGHQRDRVFYAESGSSPTT